MRLKTLEIKGFKSFADKTVLHFDKGMTGVIGPNGCGKSNIIDSIRWAIGEHKISALRSEKMSGLIFNGSKSRSSSGLAEVALTFENTRNLLPTEFSTVTVQRKYFKNGDSEYRLNDVVCRLKDIHNLFLDTGISSDTYAIIELAMVDEIIKDKDNSRRKMLEQAAGVSIYKTRKKEAQKKLKATQQDLDRIEDLLYEIEGNMKTLEGQARKAERYYKLKKKYKTTSIELAKASMEGFHQRFTDLNEKQQTREDRKQELDTDLKKTDAEIERLKVVYTEKEKELQDLQQTFNDLVNQVQGKENDKKLAAQRLAYAVEQKDQIAEFLSGADERLEDLKEKVEKNNEQTRIEEEKSSHFLEELEELTDIKEETKHIFEEKKEIQEAKRKEQQEKQQERFDIEKKVAITNTSIQNLQQSIARLEDENAVKKDELDGQYVEKEQLEEQLEEEKEHLEDLLEQREDTKENILTAQSEVEKLREQLVNENRTLDAKNNEYKLLKSMVDNLEGYPESIKFLEKNTEWEVEAPLLSDLIFCKEAYRPAIESVLEPYLNYYVVDQLEDAAAAIQLLDKKEKGKAHFFLLDQFKEVPKAPAEKIPDAIPAMEVLELDEKYHSLISSLLGSTYITTSISEEQQANNITIVEKTGKKYRSTMRMGGGSAGLFEGNKLGRSKSLEKLQEEITQIKERTDALEGKTTEKKKEVSAYNGLLDEKKIEEHRDAINQLQNRIFGVQNKYENTKALISSNEQRLEEMKEELEDNYEKITDYKDDLSSFSDQNSSTLMALEEAETEFKAADQKYNEVSGRYNELNIQYMQQQNLLKSVRQELEYQKNRLEELTKQIANNKSKKAKAEETIQNTEAVIEETENDRRALAFQREKQRQDLNEGRQAFDNIRNETGEKEKLLRQIQRERTEVEDLLGNLKEEVNELKLQLSGMKERMDVEFQINLEEILEEEREGEEDINYLRSQTEKYKKRLERMGEVNPTAIEAFEEIKKRRDFIAEQKQDLVEARDSLENTIKEVENTANKKFSDTFNQVRENFIKVFKTLFTEEDEADMFLSDPEDISNTGVEIMAKPKGKRPTAITQLSGGEKTLTSIALLFAIYLIKPAPFCILDEVDAPLDDANVGKFTNMIREFSEKSQFIIVTHNKQTMAAVDVIYGVTMQEAGVSKLVPVDFRSLEMKN